MVGNEFDGWKIFEIHRNLLGQQLIDAFNRFIDLFKASTAVRHLLAVEQHHGRVSFVIVTDIHKLDCRNQYGFFVGKTICGRIFLF
jgi:hypothetical protein